MRRFSVFCLLAVLLVAPATAPGAVSSRLSLDSQRLSCCRGRHPIWHWLHHHHHRPGPQPSPPPGPEPTPTPAPTPTPPEPPAPPEPIPTIGAAPKGLTLFVFTDPKICQPCRRIAPMIEAFRKAGWAVTVGNALPTWVEKRYQAVPMPTIFFRVGDKTAKVVTSPFGLKALDAKSVVPWIEKTAREQVK